MGVALRSEIQRYQPLPEGIALAELLRLFEECRTPGRTQLVARVRDEKQQWVERAITSIGMLATGDLLVSLDDGPSDMAPVCLDDLAASLRTSPRGTDDKLLYATTDGGATMLVCHGGYVAQRNATAAYITFVPADLPRMQMRPRYAH